MKRTKTKELKKNDSNNENKHAACSLPKKERGHYASPMVLIPLSECIPPLESAAPPKVRVSSPQKQKVEMKEKKRRRKVIPAVLRRKHQIPAVLRRKPQMISVLASAGTEVAWPMNVTLNEVQNRPVKNETLNEVQVSRLGDGIPNQEIVSMKHSSAGKVKRTYGTKKPKKKHNGFKYKIGKLIRSAPVKRKQRK